MLYLFHPAPARRALGYLPGTRRSAVRMCGAAVGSDSDGGRYVATSTDDIFFVSPLPGAEEAGPLSLWHATTDDRRVIEERQLEHQVNLLAVGTRCKHGCPQAFAYDSLSRPGAMVGQKGGRKARAKPRSIPLESHMFRLSCPLLVKAIDEWEREGAVHELNERVASDASGGLAAALDDAHRGHSAARRGLFGARLAVRLEEAPPTASDLKAVEHILTSGIAGQSPGKSDVKCLHAQAADYLCRGGDNRIGAMVLEGLEARGVDPTGDPTPAACNPMQPYASRLQPCAHTPATTCIPGDDSCCNQCDLRTPTDEAHEGWWYSPMKNKWKLRKTAERRHLIRQGVQPDTTPIPRPPSAKVRQRPLPPSSSKRERKAAAASVPPPGAP